MHTHVAILAQARVVILCKFALAAAMASPARAGPATSTERCRRIALRVSGWQGAWNKLPAEAAAALTRIKLTEPGLFTACFDVGDPHLRDAFEGLLS